MTISRLNGVLHQLRDGLGTTGPSDGQLLERFLARRDEAAFETLVRRHGPMVLGVCRRVLRHSHDAEDAFQATFLVLVRKAASVRPRELVGHWLYGVAYRTALKAKALAAKRRVKERKMPLQETHHDEPPADWLPLLDEELQRLPDKYRLPLVLCDLDGKTRKEAARQLGWPDGTLSTRLTRARLLLAERLTRRGVALAGGAAALATLSGAASAQVPATLTTSTVKAAMGFAAGSTATAVSSNVAALTQGVLKTMLLSKLKTVLAIGLVLALVGLGAGAGAFRGVADAQVPLPVPTQPPPTVTELPSSPRAAKLTLRPMPSPALVSLTRTATIAVTRRVAFYQPVTTVNDKGQTVTSYRMVDQTTTDQYSREDVHVYDSAGKPVAASDVSRLLKEEVTALVYNDGEKPDPLHLKLFKDGTLIFVLPPVAAPPPARPSVSRPLDDPEDSNKRTPLSDPQTVGVAPQATPPQQRFIDWPVLMPQPVAPPRAHPAPTWPLVPPPTSSAEPKKPHTLSDEQLKLFKELQGEWRAESYTFHGQKIAPKGWQDFRVEISQGNVLRTGFGPKYERGSSARMCLMVRPGLFDVTVFDGDDRKTSLGIYLLKGDTLTVCSAPFGEERPRGDVEAPEGKQMLTVYRRITPPTAPH